MLATAATVIASQATISGAFSMARQAVHLDLLPRLRVLQTSALEQGQIYVPIVNWLVFPAVIAFVVGFGSSDALGGAYGAAVVGTMVVTTVLGAFVAATQWNWPRWQIAGLFGLMLIVDFAFVAGNLTKVPNGGWIPLTLGALLCLIFYTWRNGRLELRAALAKLAVPRAELGKLVAGVHRVPGTGVFLASNANLVPSALIRNIEHNGVVHQRVIILNVEIADTPRQDPVRRLLIEEAVPGVFCITARFGFMETPDVAEALKACRGARPARVHRGQLVLRRPTRGARPAAARTARPAAPAVRAHAAVQHAGGGILPHAVPRRGHSQHRGRDLKRVSAYRQLALQCRWR